MFYKDIAENGEKYLDETKHKRRINSIATAFKSFEDEIKLAYSQGFMDGMWQVQREATEILRLKDLRDRSDSPYGCSADGHPLPDKA